MITSIEIKNIEALLALRSEVLNHTQPVGISDAVVYLYVKEGSLFSKREQRSVFTFFQGLNTNPQNLSIFLRDRIQRQQKNSKEKLVKGIFIVYDIFSKADCVIEINVPGNLRIFKIQNKKKQIISNEEIDQMYVSSIIRSMYGKTMAWGKSFGLFRESKSIVEQFRSFLVVFSRILQKKDLFISEDFQNKATTKGSQLSNILFEYIKQKCINHHAIEFLEDMKKKSGLIPKLSILLAQLYCSEEKYSKSLSIIAQMMNKYQNDPFLLYYQAKYMLKLMIVREALTITNSIIQYNHFQIWTLAAQIHLQLKNYSEVLVCLNHASKIAQKCRKNQKNIDIYYKDFENLGKQKVNTHSSNLEDSCKIMGVADDPLSLVPLTEQKFRYILDRQYWKLNQGQKIIYDILRKLRYRLQNKKFQELLESTFHQQTTAYTVISFKTGMTESMFIEANRQEESHEETIAYKKEEQKEDLPRFLQDESMEVQNESVIRGNKNLSIIPEIESLIQNSQYEEKEKETHFNKVVKYKKEISDPFYKILKTVLAQSEFEKAEYSENYGKILATYNKLRTLSRNNNFYTNIMFYILYKTSNFKSMLILVAETLDFYEQKGVRRIEFLPYWMEKYVFYIIEEKGLKFLNDLLAKLDFLDEAILDCIELAKQWKIKGCNF